MKFVLHLNPLFEAKDITNKWGWCCTGYGAIERCTWDWIYKGINTLDPQYKMVSSCTVQPQIVHKQNFVGGYLSKQNPTMTKKLWVFLIFWAIISNNMKSSVFRHFKVLRIQSIWIQFAKPTRASNVTTKLRNPTIMLFMWAMCKV